MAVPFQPLIASGFDALNNQRLGWSGFNARIEAENIARANEAERLQNNWLANASQLAQQAQLQDVAAAERGQQTALALAEARRRDTLAREMQKENVVLNERLLSKQQDFAREQAQTKMDYERELFDKQTKLAKDQLDLQGQHLAANYGPAKTAADEAQANYLKMQGDLIDAKAAVAAEQAKKKPDLTILMNKQKEVAGIEKMMGKIEAERNRTARVAASLENQASNAGFTINEDGTIAHPQHEKTWTWKKALSAAKSEAGSPMTELFRVADSLPASEWAQSFGATPATATATSPTPARVGRFTIVAE